MNMNHKFLSYLTPAFMAIAMGLGFAACSEEAFDSGSEGEGQITITLSSSKVASRATTPGDDTLNENYIGETRLYFYPKGSGENAAPVFEHYVDPKATSSTKVTLLMKQAKELFGDTGTECEVYALTNLPEGTVIPDDHSRKALRNVAITSPFEITTAQTSFVMDGEGTITLDRANQTATGTVSLIRSAAKIILSVNVAAEIEENGAKWRSNTNDMFVSFAHGVKKSVVDKKTDDTFTAPSFDTDMFSIPINTESGRKFTNTGATGKGVYPFVQTIPFYTYPNKCTDATNADANHPYLTLMVQWQNQTEAGAQAQYCYYQIPIGKHGNMKLDRNNIYRINLNVSKLGSFVITDAVELDMSYEVVDWSTVATDVDIKDYRYLVLNQTEYTMNNENEITIPFYSSHDVELANVTLTYFRYNESSDGSETTHTVTPEQNEASRTNPDDPRSGIYDVSYDNVNKTLTFYHDLKKTWTLTNGKFTPNNEDAYSPYKMVFTFHHTDKEANDAIYAKTVTITQYPAMYIQVEESPNWNRTFINHNNETQYSDRDKWGDPHNFRNQWDWNSRDDWSTRRELGRLGGRDYDYYLGSLRTQGESSTNSNYNNYVITITKLNNTNYTIADPRQDKINNNLTQLIDANDNTKLVEDTSRVAFWSVSAPSLVDLTKEDKGDYIYNTGKTERLLAYYYPTDERTKKSSFIAPQITIASSKGTTQPVSKIGARRRCASYQENGRPAGRWRIPTNAEIEYICKLSAEKKIPTLFSFEKEYWSANGKVKPKNDGTLEYPTNTNRTYVRCVYDEWYWKDKCDDKTTFTWGDRPYKNPEDGE